MKAHRISPPPQPKPLPQGIIRRGQFKGLWKKTTHCTPLEILGRIEEIMTRSLGDDEKYQQIEELVLEWRHS